MPTDVTPAPALRLPFDLDGVDAAPLRTDRLVLRPLRADDTDDVAAYQARPDVVAYLPWPVRDRGASAAHTAQRVAQRRLATDGDAVALAIELPGAPGSAGGPGPGPAGPRRARVVGDLTLVLTSAAHAQLTVGWVLHPDAQGRGYAREAATALLDLAFGLGAHRVAASVDPANAPSLGLCARLGMHREALFREDRYDGTAWRDTVVCAITAREWRAAVGQNRPPPPRRPRLDDPRERPPLDRRELEPDERDDDRLRDGR